MVFKDEDLNGVESIVCNRFSTGLTVGKSYKIYWRLRKPYIRDDNNSQRSVTFLRYCTKIAKVNKYTPVAGDAIHTACEGIYVVVSEDTAVSKSGKMSIKRMIGNNVSIAGFRAVKVTRLTCEPYCGFESYYDMQMPHETVWHCGDGIDHVRARKAKALKKRLDEYKRLGRTVRKQSKDIATTCKNLKIEISNLEGSN